MARQVHHHPLAPQIREQVSRELLGLREDYPQARFATLTACDDPHEFQPWLGEVTDTGGQVLCVGESHAEVVDDTDVPVVDDLCTWLGYEDFRALAAEVYGEPGFFPDTVLANPGRAWEQHQFTYVFDLDRLGEFSGLAGSNRAGSPASGGPAQAPG